MLLIVAATEDEIKPLRFAAETMPEVEFLVTGMGPVASTLGLTRFLASSTKKIAGIINIGVAGAYMDSGIGMLDICLARQEVLGDFGICRQHEIMDFGPELMPENLSLLFNNELYAGVETILHGVNIPFKTVNFVTVNCSSGTKKRGDYLRKKFAGGCENMEGAAVALVCKNFAIPCVELRCVSNMVEDRDTDKWQLKEAIAKVCKVAEVVLRKYLEAGPFTG